MATLVVLGVCLSLYRLFRRSGWLCPNTGRARRLTHPCGRSTATGPVCQGAVVSAGVGVGDSVGAVESAGDGS